MALYEVHPNQQVQILEIGHEFNGKFGYVKGVAGDCDSLDDEIPPGWVEVQLDELFSELFREQDVCPAKYTL
jgi:hypothetical protein